MKTSMSTKTRWCLNSERISSSSYSGDCSVEWLVEWLDSCRIGVSRDIEVGLGTDRVASRFLDCIVAGMEGGYERLEGSLTRL